MEAARPSSPAPPGVWPWLGSRQRHPPLPATLHLYPDSASQLQGAGLQFRDFSWPKGSRPSGLLLPISRQFCCGYKLPPDPLEGWQLNPLVVGQKLLAPPRGTASQGHGRRSWPASCGGLFSFPAAATAFLAVVLFLNKISLGFA